MKYRKTIVLTLAGLALMFGVYVVAPMLLGRLSEWFGISLNEGTQNLVIVAVILALYGFFTQKVVEELKAIRGPKSNA